MKHPDETTPGTALIGGDRPQPVQRLASTERAWRRRFSGEDSPLDIGGAARKEKGPCADSRYF